jgi:hypothetical protein
MDNDVGCVSWAADSARRRPGGLRFRTRGSAGPQNVRLFAINSLAARAQKNERAPQQAATRRTRLSARRRTLSAYRQRDRAYFDFSVVVAEVVLPVASFAFVVVFSSVQPTIATAKQAVSNIAVSFFIDVSSISSTFCESPLVPPPKDGLIEVVHCIN